jgi:hypothetical protein
MERRDRCGRRLRLRKGVTWKRWEPDKMMLYSPDNVMTAGMSLFDFELLFKFRRKRQKRLERERQKGGR